MNRRRRNTPPIPSPLVTQGFPLQQANRAVIQVVREIHGEHLDHRTTEIEALVAEAIRRARKEREGKEGA